MPVFQLNEKIIFPPPEFAREDGLLAIGGDLSPERLFMAYQMGIFPWYSEGDPILWWAPTPRLVLVPSEFHLTKRLARDLRKGIFQISIDTAFGQIIRMCAELRLQNSEETWINHDMISAYCRLHELGHAHSVECWQNGVLVGGLYGVSVGKVFFGESMFSKLSNSSKAALAKLCSLLGQWKFDFIDCQMRTDHLISLGAKEVSGPIFFQWLQKGILKPGRIGSWDDSGNFLDRSS